MTEIARLQEQLLMTAEAVPPPESPTLDAFGPTVLPKMGDRFCRGEPLTVVWNVNEIVDEVRVTINAPFPAAPIIDAPATWNELGMKGRGDVTWTVGEVKMGTSKTDLPDGELYRITMEALSGGKKIGSVESGTFSVETCQG